jgi:hypothetical protein
MGCSFGKRAGRSGRVSRTSRSGLSRRLPRALPSSPFTLLRVEPLEDRRLLTVFAVNSLADVVADDGLVTLREALQAANTNAPVYDSPAGSATETDLVIIFAQDPANPANSRITLSGQQLEVLDDVDIYGSGPTALAIDAGGLSRVVYVAADVEASLWGMTITGGKTTAEDGGAIYNLGTLSIANSTLSGNCATGSDYRYGGAIWSAGSLSISGSTIADNFASGADAAGGAIYSDGPLSITDSTISGNYATGAYSGYGGAIYNYGDLSIAGSTISDNFTSGAYATSGAVYNGSVLSITNSTISNNYTTSAESGYGGAIYNSGETIIDGSTISGNHVTGSSYGEGGAILSYGTLSITDSILSGNATSSSEYGEGGAIYNGGDLTIDGSTISGNSTGNARYGVGGAIETYGNLTITNSEFSNNRAGGSSADYEYAVGGAIYGSGEISITGSTISGNSAKGYYDSYGGGIASFGTLSLTNSTVSHNSATAPNYYSMGGGVFVYGDLSMIGSTIADNSATGYYYSYGGGVCGYDDASLSITDSTISGNKTTTTYNSTDYDYGAYGGGVHCDGALYVTSSTISGNTSTGPGIAYGGGVSGTGTLSIADSTTISENTVTAPIARGGGIYNAGTLSVVQATVSGNTAKSTSYRAYGGGICNAGTLTVVESTVSNNLLTTATSSSSTLCGGAGICNSSGTATVSHSFVSGNSTSGTSSHGGGIHVVSGTATVDSSTLSGNYGYLGGGAYNEGTLILRNSTVVDNSAHAAAGLCNYRYLTVADSTVSGNWTTPSSGSGGGIVSVVRTLPSRLTVVNSTISGNSGAGGSGVYVAGATAAASIVNSTITANTISSSIGAVYISGAMVSLHNTVVAGNTGDGPQISGKVLASSSHNVIGVSTGLSGISNGVNGNQIGTVGSPINPLLGPLADNGGPTRTHAPLPGSPLIDAGDNAEAVDAQGTPLVTDQRGLLRRFGTVDVGAVESQPAGLPVAYGDGFVVDQGATIMLDVLTNDVCAGNPPMQPQLVEGPLHGTLLDNGDGTLTYTPEPTFWGVDSFSYRAANGPLVSNTVEVTVSVTSPDSILVTTADDEVDGDLTPGDVSLREALEMAAPGSVIQFSANLLDQVIRLDSVNGPLDVSDVQIIGLGAERLTVDGCGGCRVIEASGTSLVSHLTISGGLNSGVYAGKAANLTLEDCIVSGNTSFGGSGIYNNGGTVAVVDCRVVNNTVNDYAFTGGGGILNRGTMTVTRSTISRNSARTTTTGDYPGNRGGGILNEGTLALVDSIIFGNDAGHAGGGVSNYGGTLTASGCEFLGNVADYCGGALDNYSDRGATVTNSSFAQNMATTIGGGAIMVRKGPVTVTYSTLAGNSATSGSGGAIDAGGGSLTVVNSVLVGNTASQYGGGIYASSSSVVVTVRNSTIAGNSASRGGGLANVTSARVTNSILALNQATTDPDFYGTLHAYSGFNLIGADPLFVRNPAPGDAGDLRLQPDSPAIGAGSNSLAVGADGSPLLADLDGKQRIIYTTVDIGAFEYCLPGDANYDGIVNDGDADILVAHWGMSGMTWGEGDFNHDRLVNSSDALILFNNWGAKLSQPPVALDDTYSLDEDAELVLDAGAGVLANDTDPDTPHANLTACGLSGPSHGTLTLNSDGSLTYSPTAGFVGQDSFVYRAFDGERYSEPTTVLIDVVSTDSTIRIAGDANGDGTVGADDSGILAAHWGMSGMTWADGDFNGDGWVNAADASILAANWGTTITPPSEGTPSEPQVPSALATPLVGPLPAVPSAARRSIAPAGASRGLPVAATSAAVRTDAQTSAKQAAARDAAIAEQFGSQEECNTLAESTAFGRAKLAWLLTLARRQAHPSKVRSAQEMALAVDVLLAE